MPLLKEIENKEVNTFHLEKDFTEACKNTEFVRLVKSLHLTKKEAMRKTSKLQNAMEEKEHCASCKGIFMCPNSYSGHLIVPEKKEDRLYFTYKPCPYQKRILKKESPDSVRMKDIDTKDKKQLAIIKWMDTFYEEYETAKDCKGLFLHGSFGSGKTYLLTALLNELAIQKHISIEIVYFPDALRDLKEDFDSFGYKMNRYQNVDILLIDDIGAEKVTDWGRDEVLGTILQYRMDKKKTTFFTSNLTMDELEIHLSLAKNSVDKVKARRIIERIKQLTRDLELVSENRRN